MGSTTRTKAAPTPLRKCRSSRARCSIPARCDSWFPPMDRPRSKCSRVRSLPPRSRTSKASSPSASPEEVRNALADNHEAVLPGLGCPSGAEGKRGVGALLVHVDALEAALPLWRTLGYPEQDFDSRVTASISTLSTIARRPREAISTQSASFVYRSFARTPTACRPHFSIAATKSVIASP